MQSGTFLIKLSRLTKAKFKGVDISEQFINESKNNFKKLDVNNVAVEKVSPEKLPLRTNNLI